MASYYHLDSVFPPPRNPQRQRSLSSSYGPDAGSELSPTASTFDVDLRAQLGTQISPTPVRTSNPHEKMPLGGGAAPHQYPPAAAASRSRAVSVSSVRTLGASGLVGSSTLGDHENLPPLPPLPNSATSSGSLKTTGHLISHQQQVQQQQQQQQQHYHQQHHNHLVDFFPYQPAPLSSPGYVSPSSPQHRPANNLAPLHTALTLSGSPRSLASPTSLASSLASPYPSLSSASTAYSTGASRKNSLTNTPKAPASNSSSTRSSLSSSSNKHHNHNNSFSYPTGYFSDSDTTSYYSSTSSKRIPSPDTAVIMDINNNISIRAKKGAPGKPPATLPPPVPTDLYQDMPSTPPLRLKSSNKSLKAAQNGKAVKLPPIKTELPGPRSFTSPLSPRGSSSGPRASTGAIVSPTTPSYTFSSPTKFFKTNGNQQQVFPLVNTVGNKALYYKATEVKNKLQLLVSSPAKFDEFIEFGFPTRLAPVDLALIGVTEPAASQLESPVDMVFDGQSFEQITGSHDLREQNIEIERSVFSDRQLSMYHDNSRSSGYSSPMSAVPREMTLKFTLTPASMRADEAVIYGWQSTETAMDILAADDDGTTSGGGSGSAAATTTIASAVAPRVKNGSGDVTIIADSAAVSSAIPIGGLGKDSSGSMMKRVFGKLKKNKTNGSSVMITSADLH